MLVKIKNSIVFRVGALLTAMTALAIISMFSSFVISEMADSDAAAINISGSLRKQSYLMLSELLAQEDSEFQALEKVIEASGAYEIRVAQDEYERGKIWKGRKGAFSSVGRLSPDYVVQDGVVPRSRLGEALAEIDRLSQAYQLDIANVFHAGDGNLHPLILYDGKKEGALEHAEALAGDSCNVL